VLVIDLTSGITSQDKKIAGLIQKAQKACIVVLNKCDLVKDRSARELAAAARAELFFLPYAPILVTSARTRDIGKELFALIKKVRSAARRRLGTGVLNRLLQQAFRENPPPMVGTKRLKLLYATDASEEHEVAPRKFALFVNDPKLLTETYHRYLEGRIRSFESYPGLPIQLACRARSQRV
jgi:GTP-binding protein